MEPPKDSPIQLLINALHDPRWQEESSKVAREIADRTRIDVDRYIQMAQSPTTSCGHPAECIGLDADGVGCGWCADIADMGILIDHLSRTYDHFSGGQVSKPMTLPQVVFDIASELESQRVEDAVKEERAASANGACSCGSQLCDGVH